MEKNASAAVKPPARAIRKITLGRNTYSVPEIVVGVLLLVPSIVFLVFTFVIPVGLCLQFPVCRVLGKPLGGVNIGSWVWLTPLAGPCFLGLMGLLWKWGLKHYRSTGS